MCTTPDGLNACEVLGRVRERPYNGISHTRRRSAKRYVWHSCTFNGKASGGGEVAQVIAGHGNKVV